MYTRGVPKLSCPRPDTATTTTSSRETTYLEAFVLKDTLDSSIFAAGRELGLEHDAKGAVSNDLALGVLHIASLAGQAILDLLADDFCRRDQGQHKRTTSSQMELSTYPPRADC